MIGISDNDRPFINILTSCKINHRIIFKQLTTNRSRTHHKYLASSDLLQG
jgi:hypothetical protein